MNTSILVARAQKIADGLRGRIAEIESSSRLPDDIVQSFVDAEFPAIFVPRSRGGFELDLDTAAAVVAPVAAVCPSVGWNLCFYIGTNWVMTQMSPECQDVYFGAGPNPLMAGSQIPTFSVKKVDGGYRVTGRGSWLSGSPHASYIFIAGRVENGGGPPEIRSLLVPQGQFDLIDTWQVEGMRATGSIDGTLDDVFVPESFTLPSESLGSGTAYGPKLYPDNPMYGRPADLMPLSYIMPVFSGASRGACDELLSYNRGRINSHTSTAASARASTQMHVGRLQARATLAEAMLKGLIDQVMHSDNATLLDPAKKAEMKALGAMIVDYCTDTVTQATLAAGSNAFRKQSPLQMFFRDINMISVHPFFEKDACTENYGKSLLV